MIAERLYVLIMSDFLTKIGRIIFLIVLIILVSLTFKRWHLLNQNHEILDGVVIEKESTSRDNCKVKYYYYYQNKKYEGMAYVRVNCNKYYRKVQIKIKVSIESPDISALSKYNNQ